MKSSGLLLRWVGFMSLQKTQLRAALLKRTGQNSLRILHETESVNTLGRALDNSIVIDSDPLVSRKHASIRYHDDQVFIEDLGSTNGTRLNGKRIRKAEPLFDGDLIVIGWTQFIFHRLSEQMRDQGQADTVWETD